MNCYLESLEKEVVVDKGNCFRSGGEAMLYKLSGHDDILLKLFRQPTDELAAKCKAMMANPPVKQSFGGGYANLVWPRGCVYSADKVRRFLGIEIPFIDRGQPTYALNKLAIDSKTVLVIDEAGMVGTRDFQQLVQAVEQGGGILVCVGDQRQLPSIEMGGTFGSIIERFGCVHLEEITRQKKVSEREAVKKLARGESTTVLKEYARQGQLHVEETRQKAQQQLVADWQAAGGGQEPDKHLIFVSTNREVDVYNDLAQKERIRAGLLKTSQRVRVGEETFYAGDRIIFLKKSRPLQLENGDIGTILSVKTKPFGKDLVVCLDGEKHTRVIPVRRFVGESYDQVRRAYAHTTHKLQGATVDHAYIHLGGSMTNREMAYVQASRHRETLQIYTDQHEAGLKLTNLARECSGQSRLFQTKTQTTDHSPLLQQLDKSSAKPMAHDLQKEEKQRHEIYRHY